MALKDLMPWELVRSMEKAMGEPWQAVSERLFGEWLPRVDVHETDKEIVVTASVPGLDKKDFHISATEHTLAIRGTHKEASDSDRKHGGARSETQRSFYRSFTLPATIRPDDVKASYKDGTLTVTLPKAKNSHVKRITVG